MFRKIVTELAYSPAVAGELTSYIKRVRQEKNKRQIGLIFIGLALVVQSFAVLYPPESANTHDSWAFIEGGVHSIDEYLGYYDENTGGIKDLLASLDITREDVRAATLETLGLSDDLRYWTLTSTATEKAQPYSFLASDGSIKIAYYQPLTLSGSSPLLSHTSSDIQAYTGTTPALGRFAILKGSGNLITQGGDSAICRLDGRLPEAERISAAGCNEALDPTLSARNLTANASADSVQANPSDRILYELSVKNTGRSTEAASLSVGLSDILEYAQLLDKGGGNFDEKTKTLVWPKADLQPNESLTRSFIVKLPSSIPGTARGMYVRSSYDCRMTTANGTVLTVSVACPLSKTIERVIGGTPRISTELSIAFMLVLAVIAIYFYTRAKQFLTELHRIQHGHLGSL